MQNEEAMNSTRNRIYSRKVFRFLLYWRSSILQDIYFLYRIRRFVSELMLVCLLATTRSTSAVAG